MAADVEVKKTTNLDTTLHGLVRHANYSLRVMAFTQTGDGVHSQPIFCATEEDGMYTLLLRAENYYQWDIMKRTVALTEHRQ